MDLFLLNWLCNCYYLVIIYHWDKNKIDGWRLYNNNNTKDVFGNVGFESAIEMFISTKRNASDPVKKSNQNKGLPLKFVSINEVFANEKCLIFSCD